MMIHRETPAHSSETEDLHEMLEGDDLAGMDAYSADGLLVGTVAGYLPEAPEDVQAFEEVPVDPVDPEGEPMGPRHLLIDGRGLPPQIRFVIPADQVKVDLHGRRVTLPLTMEQIRALAPRSGLSNRH